MRAPTAAVAVLMALVACGDSTDGTTAAGQVEGTTSTVSTSSSAGSEACENETTIAAVEACLLDVVAQLDSDVQSRMDELREHVDDPGAVETSQQSWEAYATAECDLEALAFAGGSQARVQHAVCTVSVTRARLEDLQRALDALGPR